MTLSRWTENANQSFRRFCRTTYLATALGSAALVPAVVTTAACSDNPDGPSDALTLVFDFNLSQRGFVAGFADYPPADESIYFLVSDYRSLPEPLETSRRALFISGVNRSDDLFMFYKAQVAGLRPGGLYRATFQAEIATNAPSGCVGVGGAPGEAVFVKAGASTVEPVPILEGGILRMNIDKGNQSNGGANALVLGNVASSVPWRCCMVRPRNRSGVAGADDHAVTAEDCAVPSANIVFSTVHPTIASRCCASNPFARRLPPRIRLYRRNVPSTRACCR